MKRWQWPKELWVGRYRLGGDMYAYEGAAECLEEFGNDPLGQPRFDMQRYILETKPKKRKRRKAGKSK